MKNFVLAALILATGSSFGTSMKKIDIRLQLATVSLIDFHHLPVGERQATVISVDSYGDVTGAKCIEKTNTALGVGRPVYTNCHSVKTVETLSTKEQRRMESLIKQARRGKIQYPDPKAIHCLAMPSRADRYTADNGTILLSAGSHPCGRVTYNTSVAAQSLVKTLKAYAAMYNSFFGEELN